MALGVTVTVTVELGGGQVAAESTAVAVAAEVTVSVTVTVSSAQSAVDVAVAADELSSVCVRGNPGMLGGVLKSPEETHLALAAALLPDETPATAALISSAVASSTRRFCVKMQPFGSLASSQELPLPVLSLRSPGANVPDLSASSGSPPTDAICLASSRTIALLVAAALGDAGSWCCVIAAISGFFAVSLQSADARPTLPVLRSMARKSSALTMPLTSPAALAFVNAWSATACCKQARF